MLLGGLLTSLPAADPKTPGQKTPIEITADGDNRFEAGVAYAEGNVIVRYGEDVLYADSITFDQKTRLITAKGNVSIYLPGKIYRGDFLEFHVDSKLVKSLDFRTVHERLYMAGKELQNPRENLFIAKDSFLSTENRENPSYRLQASTIELHPDDLVVMKNVLVKIGDVPVMWLPYVAVPLDGEMDSFEFTAGSNSRLGLYALGAYTAAINDRLSMTARTGYYSKRGVPLGLDFEFKPRAGDRGKLETFYISDDGTDIGMRDPNRTVEPDNGRYRVAYEHKYKLSPEFDTTADINIWSDRFVTEDFFSSEYRNERQPDNFADLVYYDPNFTGTLLARAQVNNLFNVTERKPEFSLEFKRQPVGWGGIFYEGESSVVNFERQFDRDNIGQSYSSVRYDTFHQLVLPKQLFGWLSLVPRAGVRGTMYTKSNTPVIDQSPNPEVGRLAFNLGLESSFKVSRVWQDVQDANWGVDGMRHVFQPYVNASFIPEPNERPDQILGFDDRVPNTRIAPINFPAFNSIDSIDEQTAIRHGVRNRLQTRRDGLNVDLLTWDLYSQANITRSAEMGILVDEVYSHVYSEMKAYPLPWLRFDSYIAAGIAGDAFDELTHSLSWQVHPAVELTVGHNYLSGFNYTDPAYVSPINPLGTTSLLDSNLVTLGSFWRLNENWRVSQYLAFEADDGTLQEQRYEIFRDLRAWDLGVGTALRDNRLEENEFLVYFTLTLKAFPEASITVDQ
jgi:LPS-assembly protein